ncbi:hypothetical protein [Roseibium sp. Sym1]|uniref:hypothetical protein n=1 Tax=Roseibium sp. Sym1 TaxID=3016006 RepID=UPI0022B49034|nr:hypothetical protein [Roseibium sp. Sym1]
MRDIEVIVEPTQSATDIVSVSDMRRHLRISTATISTQLDDDIQDKIKEALGHLDGRDGVLNRTVLPRTWKMYLPKFPAGYYVGSRLVRKISLPYPPLQSVTSIEYLSESGESPLSVLASTNYIVRKNSFSSEIEFLPDTTLPVLASHPRAVEITFTAGYTTYPETLKRLMKILAAHYLANKEATINEPRVLLVNRATLHAYEDCIDQLRVPVTYENV